MSNLDTFSDRDMWVVASWGARPDEPQSLADKFVRQVDALSSIDDAFSLWTCGALRPVEFEAVRDHFVDEVLASIVTDDFGEPDPIFGYGIGAINRGHRSSFSLNAHAGATYKSEFLQNSIMLNTRLGEVANPEDITYPVMRKALLSFVSIWRPVYGVVYPSALRKFFRLQKSAFHESWIRYLSAPLAGQIEPPHNTLVETLPDGGLLMSATTDTFDVDNPAHLAGARAIEAAIRPLNDIPASEYGAG